MRHGKLAGGRCFGVEEQRHTKLATAGVQDLEQPLAAHRRETVTTRCDHHSAVMDVDVVPSCELTRHRLVDRRVGMFDTAERLIGEDHAEPEGIVVGVALPHGDLVGRVELLW